MRALHHVNLVTPDADASAALYVSLFGIEIDFEEGPRGRVGDIGAS